MRHAAVQLLIFSLSIPDNARDLRDPALRVSVNFTYASRSEPESESIHVVVGDDGGFRNGNYK